MYAEGMRFLARSALLTALLTVGFAPAQTGVSLYGGVFQPDQKVRVGVEAPAHTALRLERVADPLTVFRAAPDPHQPGLPPGTRTTLVRTLRTGQGSSNDLDLGRLSPGLYVLRAGKVGSFVLVSGLGAGGQA